MTAPHARTTLVLLQTAARPAGSSSPGPQAAKIRRYRLARAHLQAQRTPERAVAGEAMSQRRA